MYKFIPLEKQSKEKQREAYALRRGSWDGLNPVTHKPENPKAYNRKKARKWSDDSMTVPFAIYSKLYLPGWSNPAGLFLYHALSIMGEGQTPPDWRIIYD